MNKNSFCEGQFRSIEGRRDNACVVTLDRLNTLLKSIMAEGAGATLAVCSDDLTLIHKMKTRSLRKAVASDQLCLVHLIVSNIYDCIHVVCFICFITPSHSLLEDLVQIYYTCSCDL